MHQKMYVLWNVRTKWMAYLHIIPCEKSTGVRFLLLWIPIEQNDLDVMLSNQLLQEQHDRAKGKHRSIKFELDHIASIWCNISWIYTYSMRPDSMQSSKPEMMMKGEPIVMFMANWRIKAATLWLDVIVRLSARSNAGSSTIKRISCSSAWSPNNSTCTCHLLWQNSTKSFKHSVSFVNCGSKASLRRFNDDRNAVNSRIFCCFNSFNCIDSIFIATKSPWLVPSELPFFFITSSSFSICSIFSMTANWTSLNLSDSNVGLFCGANRS